MAEHDSLLTAGAIPGFQLNNIRSLEVAQHLQ